MYFEETCSSASEQLVQSTTLASCLNLIAEMLHVVKAYIGCNPILYAKVMRIFRHIFLLANPTKEPEHTKLHGSRTDLACDKESLAQMSDVIK